MRDALERDARSLAFLDEVRARPARPLMATVELRDIVTDADRAAVLGPAARARPGALRRERRDSRFEDAIDDAERVPADVVGPRRRPRLVGFVMISDGIPAETLAADDDLIGPYYLWRLLIDERVQRQRLRHAPPRRRRRLPADAPGADVLWTSCGQERGTPQPFYERYGFVATGEIKSRTSVVLRLDLRRGGPMTATIDPDDRPRAPARSSAWPTDRIGWLTTVNPDGQPQSSPIWFLWADGEILVYSRQARATQREHRATGRWSRSTSTPTPAATTSSTMEGEARIDPDGAAATATRPTSPSTGA